jgi:glucosamine-6-phosphate deaminase
VDDGQSDPAETGRATRRLGLQINILESARAAGQAAADAAGQALRAALQSRPAARLIVATGTSQFDFLAALVRQPGIEWPRVIGFHLDEYLGIDADHPASFRRYLRERFVEQLPPGQHLKEFHYIDGQAEPDSERHRLGQLLQAAEIDLACIGIGENGHLAFNDPPADFETTEPYLVVQLDEACRRQQAGEGWFHSIDDVPRVAISMSVHQILAARTIVCTVPDLRKAEAVARALRGPVTPELPASILQTHGDTRLFLDQAAASLIS